MKTKFKFTFAVLSVMMLVCMFMLAGCGGETVNTVNPPEPEYKVHSVSLKYEGNTIEGTLTTDLNQKTISVSATVQKDSEADGTVKYTSLTPEVATIDDNGKITLVSEGEAVIVAAAGDKTHTIVLIVKDDFKEETMYTITVNGGTASVTSAAEGDYVTLSALIPEHKDFQRWNFSVRGILTSGNIFKMPAQDIVITAEYTNKLYQLNLIGVGEVYANGEQIEGEVVGNTKDGTDPEYDIVRYGVSYGTEISVTAMDAPNGKIFVGWDQGTINNRVGEMGVPVHSFEMPGENYTVWAHFSNVKTSVLTNNPTKYWDANKGSKVITDGSPVNEANDPDLEGLSGYRLTFTYGESAITDFPENIHGSTLDTITEGTNTMKAIFKNRGKADVTLELYVTFYGNIVSSGHVTVPANSVVTKYFPAGLGIWNPWMGIALRENIDTPQSGTFNVDVVLGSAPMYPEGDPLLRTTGKAELVQLDTATDTQYGWAREFHYNEKYGLATYSIYGAQFSGVNENNMAARSIQIVNMPEYDPENPTTTIYARVINNATSGDFLSIFDVCVSSDQDPRNSSKVYSATVTHEKVGDVVLIKIEVPRTENDGPFYLSVMKKTTEGTGTYYPHNFSMVLAYNNVFGYEEKEAE
jgi:hypothetical protein